MMELESREIPVIAAAGAPGSSRRDELHLAFPAPALLRAVGLQTVIRVIVLALTRTEFGLSAMQGLLTNDAQFHQSTVRYWHVEHSANISAIPDQIDIDRC